VLFAASGIVVKSASTGVVLAEMYAYSKFLLPISAKAALLVVDQVE
jgi:hypothetical protein